MGEAASSLAAGLLGGVLPAAAGFKRPSHCFPPCPLLQITSLLSMLRCMAAERAAGRLKGLPAKVVCVWAARSMGEFKALDAALLQATT